jgi:hypothetical protein
LRAIGAMSKYPELGEGSILGERMKLRIKIALVAAIASALAVVGAGWKWGTIQPGKAANGNASYKVADDGYGLDGWSWGD